MNQQKRSISYRTRYSVSCNCDKLFLLKIYNDIIKCGETYDTKDIFFKRIRKSKACYW